MRGYPERTLATRAKWLLDTRDDVEVSLPEWVEEMEATLKELANAPEPEPVGEAVDFNGWRIVRWKEEESSFPLGTKFYTSPPANNQSEQHLEMVNAPAPSVPDSDLVIDLKHASYDALTAAARRSKWIPPEYVSNDWIADCINFLENGHPAVPADMVRDAERYRWLRTYNTAKHPAVTEAFFLGDENLDAEIDAAIAAKKGGAE